MNQARPLLSSHGNVTTVTLCPNALLGFLCFAALLFIFPLGGIGALLFLAAGAVLILRRFRANMSAMLRAWWILLVPLWCLASTLWSFYPSLSLRFGIQFGLTTVIAIAIAVRVPPRTLLRMVFVALGLAAVASVVIGRARLDGAGYLGIYGSKNAFAQVMAIFLLSGLALTLGRDGSRIWRLTGLAALPFALVLLAMAQSAGWLVASILTVCSGVTFAILRRVRPEARIFVTGMVLLAVVAAGLTAWTFEDRLTAAFLNATGKDATLTGRTELWSIALSEIEQHPYVGQGFQAVWVIGNPLAESLWEAYGIATKTGFHFHNTWLSNAVEIGIVGVALQVVVFGAALFLALRNVLRQVRADTLFLAMFMVQMTIMSLLEVVAFAQFQMTTMLILITASQGLRQSRAPRRGKGRDIEIGSRRDRSIRPPHPMGRSPAIGLS